MSPPTPPEMSQRAVALLLAVTLLAVGLVAVRPPPGLASSSDFAITRISDPSPGLQAAGASTEAVVSDDGSTVVFVSTATNLTTPPAPPTTGTPEIYARDLATGAVELVSQRPDGTPADVPFTASPRVSADGRYVSFLSEADGLVADDANGKVDVFVRDRQLGTTARVTADDAPYTFYLPPNLSDDGATLVVGAGGPGFGVLLDGDWQSGALAPVAGIPGDPFRAYALAGDGATIAVGYEDAGERRVGFYDRATGAITDFAVDDVADLGQFTVSDDGQLAAFVSGGPFDTQEIKLLQRGADSADTVIDLSFGPEELRNPWLSGDGSTLVYDTYLLDCDTGFGGNCDEFGSVSSFDVATQSTLIVSRPCDGCLESGASVRPSVDETGELIAFDSSSVDLTAGTDLNSANDVFLAERLGNAAPQFPAGSAIAATQVGATFVDITWDAATDDVAVTGYEVFVDEASFTTTTGDVTELTVTGLDPETDYTIGVEAFDAADRRSDRLTVDVTTASGVGAGSAGLTGSATSATTASLSWDPADPAGLTGYRIFRSDGGGTFVAIGDVDAATTEFLDDGVDPASTYRYRVGRLDGAAVSAHTVEREITTPDVTVDRIELRVETIPGAPVATLGATARLEADGAPGLTATAELTYTSWFDETEPSLILPAPMPRTATIPLPQNPFALPGRYLAEFVVEDGIAEITSFDVTFEHPSGASATASDPALPLAVSAGVRVTIDAPPDAFGDGGPDDEWTLAATGSTTPVREASVTGGGVTEFTGFLADESASVELITVWDIVESSVSDQALTAGRYLDVRLTPRPLAIIHFEVYDDDGAPVDGARVDIFDDASGELRDTRFTGLGGPGRSFPEFDHALAGDVLRFDVSGPGIDPQTRTDTVAGGEQTITFTALETLRGTIRGVVLNDDGTPSGASVELTQDGQRRTTSPAADGTFEFAARPGLATLAAGTSSPRAGGEGIVVETVDVPEPPDIAEVELRTRGVHEYTVWFTLSVVEPDGAVSDGSQYGLRITGPGNRQYGGPRPSVVVTAGRGTEREYCVESFRRGLGQACTTVQFGDDPEIDVELQLEPAAGVTGTLVDRSGTPLVGSRYRAVFTRPGTAADFTTTSPVIGITGRNDLRLFVPEPGTWTATIIWDDPATGEDFAARIPVTAAAGQEIDLGSIFPAATGRFGATGNAVTVEPPQLLPDELARVRAAFVNDLAETRNASAVLTIPPGTTLDPDGTVLDGEPVAGSIDADGNLVVPLGDLGPGETGVVGYHLRIDDPTIGDVPVVARIVHDEASPPGDLVGVGSLSVAQVTVAGPTRSATGTVPLYGRAPAGADVTITDADREIATTTATAGGRWRTTVQLDGLAAPFAHELVASVDIGGSELRSDPLFVAVDPAWPEPIRASLEQEGRVATWDPRQGVATFPFVYHIPESLPMTYEPDGPRWPPTPINVEVEFEDPDQIRWLAVTVGDDTELATLDDGVFTASLTPFELGDVSFAYDAERIRRPIDELATVDLDELDARLPATASTLLESVSVGTDGGRGVLSAPADDEALRVVNELTFATGVEFEPSASQLDESARAGIPAFVERFEVEEAADGSSASASVELVVLTEYLESAGLSPDDVLGATTPPLAAFRSQATVGPYTSIVADFDFDKAAGAAGSAFSLADAYFNTGTKYDAIEAVRSATEGCADLGLDDFLAINATLDELLTDAVWIDVAAGVSNLVSFGIGLANPLVGVLFSVTASLVGSYLGSQLEGALAEIRARLAAAGCVVEEDPSASPRWIYDPSGYVFEGVESNRIEGATATIVEGATEAGPFTEWDAMPYAQVNPQLTEADGTYGWDVPEGWWQVRYTKDGYLPTESEVLRVLPPHFDVNVGMVPVHGPAVDDVSATAGPSGVEVVFSTYMDPTTVDISVAGTTGTVALLDEEPDPNGRPLARWYRFVPDATFTAGDEIEVTVSSGIDFAGRGLDGEVVVRVTVVDGETAPLRGSVFSDVDRSALRVDEPGIAGVDVVVTDSFGQRSFATTGADGGYEVEVPPGPVDVVVMATSPPLAGSATTAPSLSQRVVVGPGGGDADPVGFAPVTGPIDPLRIDEVTAGAVEEGSSIEVALDVAGGSGAVVAGLDTDDDGAVDTSPDAPLRYDASLDDGPSRRSVGVIATDGRRLGTAVVEIEVLNVAPTVAPSRPVASDLVVTDAIVATFTDPGVGDTHTATIEWGDGTVDDADAGDGAVRGTHTYRSAGTYDVTVCVTDDDGGEGCTALRLVASSPPAGPPVSAAPSTVPTASVPTASVPTASVPTASGPTAPSAADRPSPTRPVGGLPSTGSNIATWLAVALLAIFLGGLSTFAARRRRRPRPSGER